MLPDMLAALDAARVAAARCGTAVERGNAKSLEQQEAAAGRASSMAQRIANVVAPNWVGAVVTWLLGRRVCVCVWSVMCERENERVHKLHNCKSVDTHAHHTSKAGGSHRRAEGSCQRTQQQQ